MTVPVPHMLAEHAAKRGRSGWVATLPTTVEWLTNRWSRQVGPALEPGGRTAWVAPARSPRSGDVVLKWPTGTTRPATRREACVSGMALDADGNSKIGRGA